jgi:hypothetical protein
MTTTPEPQAPPAPDPVKAELAAVLDDLLSYTVRELHFGMSDHELDLIARAKAALKAAQTEPG